MIAKFFAEHEQARLLRTARKGCRTERAADRQTVLDAELNYRRVGFGADCRDSRAVRKAVAKQQLRNRRGDTRRRAAADQQTVQIIDGELRLGRRSRTELERAEQLDRVRILTDKAEHGRCLGDVARRELASDAVACGDQVVGDAGGQRPRARQFQFCARRNVERAVDDDRIADGRRHFEIGKRGSVERDIAVHCERAGRRTGRKRARYGDIAIDRAGAAEGRARCDGNIAAERRSGQSVKVSRIDVYGIEADIAPRSDPARAAIERKRFELVETVEVEIVRRCRRQV